MKQQSARPYWLLTMVLCGMAASSIGVGINCVGIFYTPVSDSLGILRGSFAIHATLSQGAISVMALLLPRLMARFHYKALLLVGVILAVFATGAMSFSSQLWEFYLLGILRGLGVGLFSTVPITMILTNWFHKSHGLATSITLSFSGLAGAVCSPLLTWCITQFGWRHAYLIMAAAMAILVVPALLSPITTGPQEKGLPPYGGTLEQVKPKTVSQKRPAFSYRTFCFLAMCALTLLHTSIAGIAQHFTGFSESIGQTAETGAFMMSLAMVGNICTKLVIGVLSDRFGPVKASVSMILLNAVSLGLLLLASTWSSLPLLLTAAFLYGSVYSVGAVGLSLLSRLFFGAENYSSAYSVIGLLVTMGSAISQPLIGYLYDFTGSYLPMLFVALGIHVVDLVLLTGAKKTYRKEYHS